MESEANKVQVLEVNSESNKLEMVSEMDVLFPATKMMWCPGTGSDASDCLAASTTTLNLMKLKDGRLEMTDKLANARTGSVLGNHSPPLTSFDWSAVDPNKIGASSVDSTCTIWNLEKKKIETQLIAHDKAVHDIVFARNACLFASVGADGSMRLFDQRNLDHSTIIYEAPNGAPLLRLAWNSMSTQHLATIAADTSGVILIDIRKPSIALSALTQHNSCINNIKWAPHTRNHLLCGTDDGFGMIWDVRDAGEAKKDQPPPEEPVWWYDCQSEVQQVQWPIGSPEHVGLGMGNRIDIVRI
jgi:WD repeat-containing protein 68